MFKPDKPIQFLYEDSLNRREFAKSVGEAVLNIQTEDSLVIGLVGKWGSGKTSLINMTVDHIKSCSESFELEKQPIVVYFNPWNFSDQNQLISQFFNKLSLVLERHDYSSDMNNVSKLFKTISKLATPLKFVPTLSVPSSAFSEVVCLLAEAAESAGELLDKDLDETKKQISDILRNQDRKIIIVIDDIDRLNNKEIRQTFQLVKSLANFPNTIYLLTFDKNVVVEALEKDQPRHGSEYLEKIIQVPLDIPLISKRELEKLLTDELCILLDGVTESEYGQVHWGNVYQSGFKHFFENIRDVTRYTNVLRFNYELVKDEVNAIDFIAITAIQVFIPEVYQRIRDNKEMFTGMSPILENTKLEYQQICDEMVNSTDTKIQKFLLNYLEILFPTIARFYGNISHHPSFAKSWRINRHVCSEDVFDVYFKLSIPNEEISQKEIKSIIALGSDKQEFSTKLIQLIETKKILSFLYKFSDYADNIEEKNIGNIISSFLDIGDQLPNDESFLYGTPGRIHIITSSLLNRFSTQAERFNILKNSIACSTHSLYSFVEEINIQDELYGKYHNKEAKTSNENLTLSAEHLDSLEKLACNKIKKWAEDGKLERHPKIRPILKRWKQWGGDKTSIGEVIEKVIEDDSNLVNFISNCVYRNCSHSTEDYVGITTWSINFRLLEEFIDLSVIESRLNEMKTLNKFETMDDMGKLAVKLFFDNVDNYKLN
ncbi:KAP family P-loop NTPase fold protein [Methanosarcina sp. T3]|uniref:KAP family P-loop NTPase fold protein n=1 Tax=Methanosarcina sp. T3 TaxID=3439062 RepID=UPI003F831BBE